jgi:DNA-directed RNA polymerase specialized sigma24 family protein
VITGATNAKRPPLDPVDARRVEEAETGRLMQNWAQWKSGASISVAVSSAFNLEARGRREAVSVPLLNGEASDVDAAVDALPADLRAVVTEHWLAKGTAEKHAKVCGCEIRTYYRRLDHAHERIRALMRAKRTEAERTRTAYRAHHANHSDGNLRAPPVRAPEESD